MTLCDRNLYKFLHTLFCFDSMKKISISHIQRIASLASRTSMLSRHMRPCTLSQCLFQRYINVAQSDILMWRSFASLLMARPALLSRTLDSFRPRTPQYCFKYDASLFRIAVGVYNAESDLPTYLSLSTTRHVGRTPWNSL